MEGAEFINRTQVGGKRILKAQQVKEVELIFEIKLGEN